MIRKYQKQFSLILLVGLAILVYYWAMSSLNIIQVITKNQLHRMEESNQVTTSVSSSIIDPKQHPGILSTPTNQKLKSTANTPSSSTEYIEPLSNETLQAILNQQYSNITTNTSINSYWNQQCLDVAQIVLNRINYIQNPHDCSTARKVVCAHTRAGMGSTVHHWAYCLTFAYYTNRTMVLDITGWQYLKNIVSKDGIEDFHDLFQRISKCNYTDHDKKIAVSWSNPSMDSTEADKAPQVIRLELAGYLLGKRPPGPKICHYGMPTEIFYSIMKFKHKPMAWWVGLLAQYIIRPNDYLQQFIDQSREQFQFHSPIVGLHIRRTDKAGEAKLFNIDQYMVKVKLFFDNLARRDIIIKRRVFVTTDEPQLIPQLKSKYTNYQFIHPPLQQLKAGVYTTRYSALHLKYFMRDLFLLSECDYLVVTMTSNVGRLAYELHEVLYSRTQSQHYTSLDIDYNIFAMVRSGGPWILQAKQDCYSNASNGLNLTKGDILDSCMPLDKKYTRYRCFSQRLQMSGSLSPSCVTYLIDDDRTFPDYSELDESLHSDKIYEYQYFDHDIQNTCTKLSVNDIQL